MIEFKKETNELINFLSAPCELYVLKNDLEVIGYGKVIKNSIEIYILPNYRARGFGKKMFFNILKTFEDNQQVFVTFANNNFPMKKIVESYGAKQYSINEGIITYIINPNN